VVSDAAEHLLSERARTGRDKADFVVSGIPLGNLPRQQTLALIDKIGRSLREGGMYIQFQYSLMDRRKIRQRFTSVRTVPVPLNFPPAVVYYALR
jgi:phospholipid N-methyltransferase